MRKINKIVIHSAATPPGVEFDIDDIRKWHTDPRPEGNGWNDVGYHFVILLNGTIQIGRPIEIKGAHVGGHNDDTIGICYIGGGIKDKEVDSRTIQQKASLVYLIAFLKRVYRNATVCGHRDFSIDKNNDGILTEDEWMKKCPCFDAVKEYKNI